MTVAHEQAIVTMLARLTAAVAVEISFWKPKSSVMELFLVVAAAAASDHAADADHGEY